VLEHVYFSALEEGARRSAHGQRMEEIFTAHAQRTQLDDVVGGGFGDLKSASRDNKRSSSPSKDLNGPVYEISERFMSAEVKRTHSILRRFLFESGDSHIPTCFIIVNQKLTSSKDNKKRDSADSIDELESIDGDAKNQLVVPGVSNASVIRKNQCRTARRWYNYFYEITNAQRVNDQLSASTIASEMRNMCAEEELYLYFLDEVTMKVIPPDKNSKKLSGSVYPIQITNALEFIPKIFPLLKVSLHAIAAFRDMEVLCRSFGFPSHSSEDVDIHAVNCFGEISASSAEKDYDSILHLMEETGLLTMASPRNSAALKSIENGGDMSPSRDPRATIVTRDANLYKILSSRVFAEDTNFSSYKSGPLKELSIFLAAHDAVAGYGSLQKVQLKENVVTFTTKSNINKFMKIVTTEVPQEKSKNDTRTTRRYSNDSVNGIVPNGSGSITVDEVNDNVLGLKRDLQRLQQALDKINKREELKSNSTTSSSCFQPNGCGCIVS